MILAIASKRGPKVEAVHEVILRIRRFLAPAEEEISFVTREVDAGISMPRSVAELMSGAFRRVELLREELKQEQQEADYFIGMEGGFHAVPFPAAGSGNLTFLQSWAYVADRTMGAFGSSGNIMVPAAIAREVMEKNRDLSEVIDEFESQTDIRSRQGTWGVLSKDLISRRQSFETALIGAFARFYNREVYGRISG